VSSEKKILALLFEHTYNYSTSSSTFVCIIDMKMHTVATAELESSVESAVNYNSLSLSSYGNDYSSLSTLIYSLYNSSPKL
jgi:hypothetical protein